MSGLHVKYLLVGGGVASSAAAAAIRRHDRDGSILLVGQEVNRPYNRPLLSKDYLLGKTPRSALFTHIDDWFADNRAELRTGRRAARLDAARRTVTLDSGEDVAFDNLLIATGATAKHLNVPGAELPNVFYLRTLDDADRLHNAIEKAKNEGRRHDHGRGRVAIIGASLLGVELAATLRQIGLGVDLILAAAHPWRKYAGENAGRFLTRYLESLGIKVHTQTVALRLEGDGRVQRVVLSDGAALDVDFVVGAVGINPNKDLLRGTSISAEKAILVDEHCRTSDPGIYAAGDCAAVLDPLFGKYRHIDHWESAMTTGAIAGANMAGANEAYSTVNHFYSELAGLRATMWGEARLVERRIVRGNANVENPDFLEIGVAADGRVSQILAFNHKGEDELLAEIVRRRLSVDNIESELRDPAVPLATLLS